MPLGILTLTVYLVILSNFILGIVIYKQPAGYQMSDTLQKLLIGSYFFIFYILFLLGSIYYLAKIKKIYKKKEAVFLSLALVIGLIVGAIVSYKSIGLSDTLQWAIPTTVTLVLAYIFHKLKLNE